MKIIVEIVVGTVELCGDKSWRKMEAREKRKPEITQQGGVHGRAEVHESFVLFMPKMLKAS